MFSLQATLADLSRRSDLRAAAQFPLLDLAAIVAYMLMILSLRGLFRPRNVQQGWPGWRMLIRDISLSAVALEVGSLLSALLAAYLFQRQWLRADLAKPSAASLLIQASGTITLYDLYLFGVHRLLHLGPLFTYLHSVHHRSTAPTPVTAFAIHPIEAVINFVFLPAFMVLTPVNFYAVMAAGLYFQVAAIVLHSGHEVFPRWWRRSALGYLFPTVRFHDFHHSQGAGNYGIITTIWDRLFGTTVPIAWR